VKIGPKKTICGEGNTIGLAAGGRENRQAFHGRVVAAIGHSRDLALFSSRHHNHLIANHNPLFTDLSANFIQKYSSNVRIIVGVKGVNHFGEY